MAHKGNKDRQKSIRGNFPRMTMKVSNAFNQAYRDCKNPQEIALIRTLAANIADAMHEQNSSFSRSKFIEACGFDDA